MFVGYHAENPKLFINIHTCLNCKLSMSMYIINSGALICVA